MSIEKPTKKFTYLRDDFRCRKCGKTKALQLHHVLPQRLNGPDDSFNLITLCHDCHSDWHVIENELGVGQMEKRVIEAFYLWLKEEKNANIFLQNVKLFREIEKAKSMARKKKRKDKRKRY